MQKQIADAQSLQTGWETAKTYDLGAAFQGLVSLMNEQHEKVDKASTQSRGVALLADDHGRHPQQPGRHPAGLRAVSALDPVEGGRHARRRAAGTAAPRRTARRSTPPSRPGFAKLQALYDSVSGDAIPQPPDTWSSVNPTTADLATPFGMLYMGVHQAVDPEKPGSVVAEMNRRPCCSVSRSSSPSNGP